MSDATTSSEVSWLSNAEGVATVNGGLVTFVAAGNVIITATSTADTTQTASVSFTVNPATVTSVSIGGEAARAATLGDADVQLTATVTMSDATTNNEVTWLSNAEGVATVDGGLVTFVTAGEVVITATSMADSTKMATVTFTVTYAVGDTGPAGGVIFYINPNAAADGWTYLESSRADQSTSIEWGGYGISVGTSKAIGTGETNTEAIVSALTTTGGIAIDTYAAGVCSEYSTTVGGNTFDDWFLPSLEELKELYAGKSTVGSFANNFYWSSSAYSANTASGIAFNDGAVGLQNLKTLTFLVRAVRAF